MQHNGLIQLIAITLGSSCYLILAVKSKDNRPKKNLRLFDFQSPQETASTEDLPQITEHVDDKPTLVEFEGKKQESPFSVYQAVLPVILNKLDNAATAEELAEILDVNKIQLNAWLKKVVEDGYKTISP